VSDSRRSFEESAHRRAVGARIAEIRKRQDLTQLELASRADAHRPYLTAVEGGHRNPSLDFLAHIAAALEVPLVELFKEPGS